MNKIKAFFTALALLALTVILVHFVLEGADLKTDGASFGTWYSTYRDMSKSAISDNIHDETLLVLGSSEFHHGRNTVYHPANMPAMNGLDLMLIGGPWNQSLFHTILLGSVEKDMPKRKVVMLVSPTWFKNSGIKTYEFCLRFSETEYIEFMDNPDIPEKIKKYAAGRVEELTREDSTLSLKAKIINRHFERNNSSLPDPAFQLIKAYAHDSDVVTTGTDMLFLSKKKIMREKGESATPDRSYWDEMYSAAERDGKKESHNMFMMNDRRWKDFAGKYKRLKKYHAKDDPMISPEKGDYEAFLELCKAVDIKPLIIILPVNGKWYDYTGMKKSTREELTFYISSQAEKYGAKVADLSGYEYTDYFTEDQVHPGGCGWVKINEEIYKFDKENS